MQAQLSFHLIHSSEWLGRFSIFRTCFYIIRRKVSISIVLAVKDHASLPLCVCLHLGLSPQLQSANLSGPLLLGHVPPPLSQILSVSRPPLSQGWCLRSQVPVISWGAITHEMTVLFFSLSSSQSRCPLYSSFSSPRFPRTTPLHAPLSCWGREHHKDGVCSACAYTHTRARTSQVILRCGWTDVCMLQHSWEMWRGMCVHMPNLKWEHLNKYKGTSAVPLNPHYRFYILHKS